MLQPKTLEYYDWMDDIQDKLLTNLNEILVYEGIEPCKSLHGGTFLDGKWVGVQDPNDYRNFWHVYLELFGEGLSNDQFQVLYVHHPDDNEGWQEYYDLAYEFCNPKNNPYNHSDPNWASHLVTAFRKTLVENITPTSIDGYRLVFWWSW